MGVVIGLVANLTGFVIEPPSTRRRGVIAVAASDCCGAGVVFVAKDPQLNPARYTKSDLYYISLQSADTSPQLVKTGNLRGYSSSPVFSPDGKSVAFARMKADQYESDKPRLLLIPNISDLSNVQEFYATEDGRGSWDLRPDWITWSNDGKNLYVAAEKHGRRAILFVSLLGNAMTLVLFGWSTSLGMAFCARAGQGLFNGAVGVARGAVRDITDPTNEGRAYSLLGVCWGLGGIVGPIIGGLLEHPVRLHLVPDITTCG